jgi:hypothetical protein
MPYKPEEKSYKPDEKPYEEKPKDEEKPYSSPPPPKSYRAFFSNFCLALFDATYYQYNCLFGVQF